MTWVKLTDFMKKWRSRRQRAEALWSYCLKFLDRKLIRGDNNQKRLLRGDCEVFEGVLEVVGCSVFLWLHGCTHLSDPIKLYTEGLCTSLYVNCKLKQRKPEETCKYRTLVTGLLLSLLWVNIPETAFLCIPGLSTWAPILGKWETVFLTIGERSSMYWKGKSRDFSVVLDCNERYAQ